MRSSSLCVLILLCLIAEAGFAQAVDDPLEGMNRAIQSFNDTADRWLLRPLARGYRRVMPDPGERAVTRVFADLIRFLEAEGHAPLMLDLG